MKIRHSIHGSIYTVWKKKKTFWLCLRTNTEKPIKIFIKELGWYQELKDIKL